MIYVCRNASNAKQGQTVLLSKFIVALASAAANARFENADRTTSQLKPSTIPQREATSLNFFWEWGRVGFILAVN